VGIKSPWRSGVMSNDGDLVELATRAALAIGTGHSFVIVFHSRARESWSPPGTASQGGVGSRYHSSTHREVSL
jgi:hypothetical protein